MHCVQNQKNNVTMNAMKKLDIKPFFSTNMRRLATINSFFLLLLSLGIVISMMIASNYAFLFYVGICGIILGVVGIYLFLVWQGKPLLSLDENSIQIRLPGQRVVGSVDWINVTQLHIGLSDIHLRTIEGSDHELNLENLRYTDIKSVKSKLIEICETRKIPYQNS